MFPEELRRVLNDLRGFRHLFRHGYDFELNGRRLAMLVRDWNESSGKVLSSLAGFAAQLRENELRG